MKGPDHTAPELSIVVPAFQEGEGVRRLHDALTTALEGHVDEWELVLVDDGSSDDTWAHIAELAARVSAVRGLRLSRNFGKEAALAAGLHAARGAAVVTMDADLQHPPSAIPAMLERWRDGAVVVDGVKRTRTGQSRPHRAASALFNAVFSRVTGVDLVDASDFKLLDRRAVEALEQLEERGHFYRGTAQWIGFPRASVSFEVDPRSAGGSRWHLWSLARLAVTALTSFTAKPLHLVTLGGIGFLFFAAALAAQTLVRFFRGDAVEGFTTVILLLLLLGGMILIGLGIIGEYLARIHEEVKGRPRYIVSDQR